MLTQQGYDCLGATMLLHGDAAPGARQRVGRRRRRRDLCTPGLPHEVIDMRETFERHGGEIRPDL
ncbi:MAG: hypothetical protein ACLTKG_02050 [Collinsella intestinalis]